MTAVLNGKLFQTFVATYQRADWVEKKMKQTDFISTTGSVHLVHWGPSVMTDESAHKANYMKISSVIHFLNYKA